MNSISNSCLWDHLGQSLSLLAFCIKNCKLELRDIVSIPNHHNTVWFLSCADRDFAVVLLSRYVSCQYLPGFYLGGWVWGEGGGGGGGGGEGGPGKQCFPNSAKHAMRVFSLLYSIFQIVMR